jgi:hypothetical protein
MVRFKAFADDKNSAAEIVPDGEDKLLLIDDAAFVNAFAEAGRRRGKELICVRCFDPVRVVRAVVLLVDGMTPADESSGSVGFCSDCYQDLAELLVHDAILRAAKPTPR